jgi:hypothetical protein
MHAGGGTNDRGEKINVLIVSVLLLIGSYLYAAQQYAAAYPNPLVCVFYYCRTYYKAVRVGGGGEWRTCVIRDDEPRPVTVCVFYYCRNYYKDVRVGGGTREEPGTLTQGAPVFPCEFSLVPLASFKFKCQWESNPKLQGVWSWGGL